MSALLSLPSRSKPTAAQRREPHAERPPFLRGPAAFIAHYVRTRRYSCAALFLMVLGAGSCAVAIQYVMKLLVDAMAGPRGVDAVWVVLALFLGLIAVESILWRISGWLGCRTSIGIGVSIRVDLFRHLHDQPMRFFSENLAGSLGQRITATAGNFGALMNTVVWRVLPPCIDFIGGLIVFLTVDWRIALALAGFVAVVTGGLVTFGQRGGSLHRSYAGQANAAGGDLIDVIANMWAVKAFSGRTRESGRLERLFQHEAAAQRASWMYTEKARVFHDIALLLMAGTMLSACIYLWSRGSISPGDVVLVSALTFRILHGSRDIALSFVDMMQNVGYIDETLRVIGQAHAVRDAPGAPALIPGRGAVEFDNVSFAYGGGRDAVHDVNLKIPAGQKVGIVGPSGAGKSTLINLLQRLYDVQKGRVLIDGQPIAGVTQESLRPALAVVPQELTLFHRSIMENIRVARPDASDEEVRAAAKAAHCDDFIRASPQGFDTLVGERGTKLSGGQRQRIGIARAFLKNAPIMVLDEATSALDPELDLDIQRAIVRLMSDRTVIAVSHRLSSLIAFDRIVVMSGGRIVEDGAPADLTRSGGIVERMWQVHAEAASADRLAGEAA